ncbi:NAD(FAD)-dependent dehydrogenase, partial [Acinetobacter baumannii]
GFYNAGGVLFGVADYVPALMEYVKRYNAKLNFHNNLVAIDGNAKKAWFAKAVPDQPKETVEVSFDMIHVTPPQCAPDF